MVQATQSHFGDLLSQNMQLRVPLYQRHYHWRSGQWDTLFNDILLLAGERASGTRATHFLGSLVLATPPGGSKGLLVVDGQQRLVTTSLLLCALRDEYDLGARLENRIRKCLYVFTSSGQLPAPIKRLKVLPTQVDREAFARIVDGQVHDAESPITKCYSHFVRRLSKLYEITEQEDSDIDDEEVGLPATPRDLAKTILGALECIRITASPQDNAHRIFESLNNTGMPLTQSDLIRNYVFMHLDEKTEDFYVFTWHPLERRFTPDEFTQLFWLDLILQGRLVNQRQTYVHQQRQLQTMSKAQLRDYIGQLSDLAGSWEKVVHPSLETSSHIRRRLERMREWKTTTAQPTLTYLLESRRLQRSTWGQVERAMHYLESYFVRRVTIGRATMNMNRILMAAPSELERSSEPVDIALRRYLSGSGKYWATDEEIYRSVDEKPFYRHGRAHQKTLILRWIEESLRDHEDQLDTALTVEHVMPRDFTSEWLAETRRSSGLSAKEARAEHSRLVDTLGNLTLCSQAKNSKMSNKSFADKKQILHRLGSGMHLTKEITKKHHWGPGDIRARSQLMADRIIANWPGPIPID